VYVDIEHCNIKENGKVDMVLCYNYLGGECWT